MPTLPEGAIRARGIWKRFRADRRHAKLRYEVQHLIARLRGAGEGFWRWALRDVDLEVQPGESVGLVGSNGSGKSTLLKIVSRVMRPTLGTVDVRGRVGALIEVVAGIHPDLTGRENLFLYGSLLGLPRSAVARRFDEIVAFAELDNAIDRLVKFYSTGMKMRLGFSVAAFLEPDILLVDEVLAVGDAAFQQKCLDRMREVLAQGTTLFFVSHDLAAVEATCARALWLADGVARVDGPVRSVLGAYRQAIEQGATKSSEILGPVRLASVTVTGPDGGAARTQEPLSIVVRIESERPQTARLHLGVSEGPSTPIFVLGHDVALPNSEARVCCTLPRLPLPRGRFYLWVGLVGADGNDLLRWHPAASLDVIGPVLDVPPRAVVRLAPVHVEARWESQP